MEFRFKKFNIIQDINSQKVGSDSMLLGAWTNKQAQTILDIGTGTGVLALMLAQQNTTSKITAIEPDANSLLEAAKNFKSSDFSNQLKGIKASLQEFKTDEKFDLIISNPPYFENSTLSIDQEKNRVRHTNDLSINDLYFYSSQLLTEDGSLFLIFPTEVEFTHFNEAKKVNLFPRKILRTKRDDGIFKRTMVEFSFKNEVPIQAEIIVKHTNNKYSKEYIELTKEFYFKDLSLE